MKRKRISSQIVFLLCITIALEAAFMVGYYFRINGILKSRTETFAKSTVRLIVDDITNSVIAVKNSGMGIANNPAVQEYLASYDISVPFMYNSATMSLLHYLKSANKDILDIALINTRGNVRSLAGIFNVGIGNRLLEQYDYMSSNFTESYFTSMERYGKYGIEEFYALIVPVFDMKNEATGKRIGTCILLCNGEKIQEMLENIHAPPGASIYIVDTFTNRIVSGRMSEKPKNLLTKVFSYNDFAISMNIVSTNWQVRLTVDPYELYNDLLFFNGFIISFALLVSTMIAVTVFYINRNINKPITKLNEQISNVGEDSGRRVDLRINNEIGTIAQSINKMLDQIEVMQKRLLKNEISLYKAEADMQRAKLNALQSQINPHFLYNTLDCIRAIGLSYQAREVVQISTALADIFRYSIKGPAFVRIEDEIEIVRQYFRIMEIRFDNRFMLQVELPEKLMGQFIPRMSLQPLVENAIYHGLEPKLGPGSIAIGGWVKENVVYIVVKDNGVGMDNKELHQLQDYLSNTGDSITTAGYGMGLMNIDRKIRIMFGGEYGLKVESWKDKGTTIYVKLPLLTQDDIQDTGVLRRQVDNV